MLIFSTRSLASSPAPRATQGVLSAHMSGGSGGDDSAQQWLQEQKLKLVAQKKVEREAETAQYKAAKQGKVRRGGAEAAVRGEGGQQLKKVEREAETAQYKAAKQGKVG